MPWWQILVFIAVLGWLYASLLRHLVGQWAHDPNYSHGFFVPLFSLFVIWSERDKLRKLAVEPSWSGLLVLFFGLAVLAAGTLGAELFLSRVSLLLTIAGLVVIVYGWNHMRAIFFPWIFLLFMIPSHRFEPDHLPPAVIGFKDGCGHASPGGRAGAAGR